MMKFEDILENIDLIETIKDRDLLGSLQKEGYKLKRSIDKIADAITKRMKKIELEDQKAKRTEWFYPELKALALAVDYELLEDVDIYMGSNPDGVYINEAILRRICANRRGDTVQAVEKIMQFLIANNKVLPLYRYRCENCGEELFIYEGFPDTDKLKNDIDEICGECDNCGYELPADRCYVKRNGFYKPLYKTGITKRSS